MKSVLLKPIFISACALLMAGCAVNPNTGKAELKMPDGIKNTFANQDPCSNNARNTGILIGGVAGAVIGNQVSNSSNGKLIGALLGAAAGGLIGSDIDDRRCALSKIAKDNNMALTSTPITQEGLNQKPSSASSSIGLDVAVQQGDEFVPGTSTLTPAAQRAYGAIADQYKPVAPVGNTPNPAAAQAAANAAKSRKLLIVGHADESGNSEQAAKLSEARAKAVAHVFAAHGVPSENIYYQGAGDTLPVANNATENGAAANRRVQIVDVPSETELKQYLNLRSSDPRDFVAANNQSLESVAANAPVEQKSLHGKKQSAKTVAIASQKAPSATFTAQVVVPAIATPPKEKSLVYDFGGKPDSGNEVIALGDPVGSKPMLNLISTANADPLTVGSCRKDHPHITTAVKNLESGQELSVRDAQPGLYGAPITGSINGNYIAILNPYAPKDAGMPIPQPTFEVYKDYSTMHGAKPTLVKQVPVNVYRGSDATLYRMFVGGQLSCMDLVVPIKPVAIKGNMYYLHDGKMYVAQGEFLASK